MFFGATWKAGDPSCDEYATTVGSSKIWIATHAPFGDITPRVLEIAASNTMVFCQELHSHYSHIFQDGVNCVQFKSDLSDFEEKLDYYLENEDERFKIIENGFNHIHENYTCSKMAELMIQEINNINGK